MILDSESPSAPGRTQRSRLLRRALLASFYALGFVLPLIWLLSTEIPATSHTPLTPESPSREARPVKVPGATYVDITGNTNSVYRLRLVTHDVGRLSTRSEVRLLVTKYYTNPSLDSGELAFTGTECVYRTVRGTRFPNNDVLTFKRGAGCSPLLGVPTGELRLTLRFFTPGTIALWTFLPKPGEAVSRDAVIVEDRAAPESWARPIVRGTLVDTYPANKARRIDLLAYVWQVAPSSRWLWVALGCSGVLIWCAAFCFWGEPSDATRGVRSVARSAFGAFCAAAALSLTYAVIVPPFQAADEPNHFFGFLGVAGRLDLGNDVTAWARLTHFERIQFHPEEHFGPFDVGQQGAIWNDGAAPDAIRGSGAAWVWRPVASTISSLAVPRILLTLRLFHSLLFSLAIAVSVALLTLTCGVRHPVSIAIPLFLIPTLPFFGMHLSNYALLVDLYILLATGILIAFWHDEYSYLAGPIIGAAWIASIAVSRSAIPLAPLIGIVLVARLVLGGRHESRRSILIFWIGFSASLMVGIAATDSEYVRSATSAVQTTLPRAAVVTVTLVVEHPWILLVVGALAAGAEYTLSAWRQKSGTRLEPRLRSAARIVAVIAALVGIAMLVGSFVFQYPVLNTIDPAHPPALSQYIKDVVLTGLTTFRFGHPDFLTSVTFWGGFGWLDTLPSNLLVSALAGASGLALVAWFVWIARTASYRTLVWLLCLLCAYALTLITYAVSVVRVTPADLHGRYLLGVYLCLLLVVWSSIARFVEHASIRRATCVTAGLGICCVVVHVYALSVIIARYF